TTARRSSTSSKAAVDPAGRQRPPLRVPRRLVESRTMSGLARRPRECRLRLRYVDAGPVLVGQDRDAPPGLRAAEPARGGARLRPGLDRAAELQLDPAGATPLG